MKFFVDTGDIAEIRELQDAGLIDGVTTNPSLVLKATRSEPVENGTGYRLTHGHRALPAVSGGTPGPALA